MRRALGTLVLTTLLLAGCGDDGDGEADDPAPSGPGSSSSEASESSDPSDPSVDWRLVAIVDATAADGEVSVRPTPIPDEAAVVDFSEQFSSAELAEAILDVVRANRPAPGHELVAAVIAIGCDVPTAVTYADGKVHAVKVPDPMPECFAAVTSVAILEVPA